MTWKAGDHAILRRSTLLDELPELYRHWEGQEVILIEDGGEMGNVKKGFYRRWWIAFVDPACETYAERPFALEPALQPLPPMRNGNDPKAQRLLDALALIKAGKIVPGWNP